MKTLIRAAVVGAVVLGLSACDTGPAGSAGFTLPEGDAEKGKADYIAFSCHACHSSSEVPQMEGAEAGGISIALGGETARVRTYGELVTSIVNPSHRVARRLSDEMVDDSGESRMATFNDVMTVTQLIDLVAFLQSSYKLSPYQNTAYPVYWYPDTKGEKK